MSRKRLSKRSQEVRNLIFLFFSISTSSPSSFTEFIQKRNRSVVGHVHKRVGRQHYFVSTCFMFIRKIVSIAALVLKDSNSGKSLIFIEEIQNTEIKRNF